MQNVIRIDIGTFEISSGKIYCSDPCYKLDTWCAGTVDNVKNGTWKGSILKTDESNKDDWENGRVTELIGVHTEYTGDLVWEETEIDGGVDSGQFGFYDYDFFVAQGDARDYHDKDNFYSKACGLTHIEKYERYIDEELSKSWGFEYTAGRRISISTGGVIDNAGIVSSSGYGDGGYPVFIAKDEDGKVIGVKAVFISDYKDEEEEEEVVIGTEADNN